MNIIIEELNLDNAKFLNTIDGEFMIDSRLRLYVQDEHLRFDSD